MSEANSRRRLDGWKAVASHFRRDRSTVMRWSRERGLPYYRVPGEGNGSIFAFTDELDGWMALGSKLAADHVAEAAVDQSSIATPEVPTRSLIGVYGGIAAVGIIALVAVALALSFNGADARRVRLPQNAAAAQNFVEARDSWARRTPADLEIAIKLYRRVIAAEPSFAPAWAGLADAWLIIREYGGINDVVAYREAERAARQAIALQPQSPGGLRAMGFISYWWRDDPVSAHAYFKGAITADPDDAQSHFWYANMLADVGDPVGAERSYERARTLDPGSRPIAVERACARWQAGDDVAALRSLTALKRVYPKDATIHNCLTYVHIGRGDIRAFADAYRQMAETRDSPTQRALAAKLDRAVARDARYAHRVLIAAMLNEIGDGKRPLLETAAYYASSVGDRSMLVKVLEQSVVIGQRWTSATIRQRIARRWRDDTEVMSMLDLLNRAKNVP